MITRSGGKPHVHMPAAHGAGGQRKGEEDTTPEKQLNGFVRAVALIERMGNALGTLAFTWATVVLLGGYPTNLRNCDDFWFAITICFIEAARMFSRNNRMDYQLFFGTRGAFRLLGWNELILVVYYIGTVLMIANKLEFRFFGAIFLFLPVLWILVAVGQFVCLRTQRLLARHPLTSWDISRAISLWSPMVAIILLVPSVPVPSSSSSYYDRGGNPVAKWVSYIVLLVVVLLVTISRMRFPVIMKVVDSALGGKQEFWGRLVLTLCMIGAIGIALSGFVLYTDTIIFALASTLVLVSFRNLQVPAATVRVVLSLIRLIPNNYNDSCDGDGNTVSPTRNLAPSLDIFYGMVLAQGLLYAVACLLEIFSFIPRRRLLRRGGFRGQWGVDSVDMYYAYAMEKCMERNVLAPNISLCSFAIDSLNSDSTKRQLHGIRITHTLLRRDATRTRILVKLNASTKTMTRLMRMLDWAGQEHETIRLFAVKVIDELAKGLLVVTVPGIVQNVSLLLDCGNNQQKSGNPLLYTDDEQEQQHSLSVNDTGNPMVTGDAVVSDTRNLLETQDQSIQQVGNNEQNSCITRWRRLVSEFWSIPQEGPLTEQDLLPVLGMSIIESLATYHQSNCEEISKATGLIRKITRFTRFCRSDTDYTDAEKKVLVHSSLKLFHKLTSIHGEVGIILRQKISNHPFLLRNLSEILGDITSCHEPRKLAAGILRNLAVDASTRQTIGGVQSIITRLMHAFLTPDMPSSTDDGDRLLRKVAGQALAMLAMDNANNCLAMLRETRYSFIKDLTAMINIVRYRCVAASLLRSVCMHARPELKEEDLDALSYSSREVLERILRAEGAELEIFVGLSSHIYKAIPEKFAREFECSQIKETFVKKLVDVLNANMEPSADCPGIRRVILEQAINLMEYDSSNVNCFIDRQMIQVLSMVEETMSDAENYSIFLGDVGLMEAGQPMSSLVARAKQLLGVR